MVRHIAEHHAALVFAALVQRFIIAKLPAQPLRGHLLKVLRGAFRRGGKRQHARVRRDHAALVRTGQRQLGNAEGAILIVHRRVKRAVGALGYAPRPAPPLAVANLRADRAAGAHAQKRPRGGGHEQEGHHILEHRAAPRIQRTAAARPRARPTQFFPVAHGNAALGHRHIGQDARFGCQQVVMRLPRRVLLRVVADTEQPALLVVQAFQLHFVDQRLEPPRVLLRRGAARHKQRGEQVSAVHAGNVGRAQRIQRARVIPVIQKPVPLGQRMQRAQRFPKPRAHLARVDQPQLARRHAAHQIHADVRGRRALRRARAGIQLHVVRRQTVAGQRHKALEILPRIARGLHHHGERARRKHRFLVVGAQTVKQRLAQRERRRERQRDQQPCRARQRGQQKNRLRHARHVAAPVHSIRVRRGDPFQHSLMRNQHSIQCAQRRGLPRGSHGGQQKKASRRLRKAAEARKRDRQEQARER